MRLSIAVILFSLFTLSLQSQSLPPLTFHGQPLLKQGISIAPYALFYEDPSGDTTRTLTEIVHQHFVPAVSARAAQFRTARRMKYTSEVNWLQFRIANTHPSDTLYLLYSAGPHAVASLYAEKNGRIEYIDQSGLCTPQSSSRGNDFGLPLVISPHSTQRYFIRSADYLVMLAVPTGIIHTVETFQKAKLEESSNSKWLAVVLFMTIGCILLMSFYTFLQYRLSKDKAFLFYSLYAAIAFCWMMMFANPRFDLGIMPASMPWLNHPLALSFSYILSILHAFFLSAILSIPQQQPAIWRIARPLMIVLAFLQVMVFVQLFTGILVKSSTLYFIIDAAPGILMGLLMIVATIRSKSKLKLYLLIGEIALYVYVIALSPAQGFFYQSAISPQLEVFINYPPVFIGMGILTELFCFLLALARRNKLIEEERNNLQKNYTRQLETELAQRTEEIQKQSHELEQQHASQLKLSFEQKLAEMEMTALRAQMNPHFIFNCLNSIKLYTTENESEKASEYLTKFSRLIRLVLENSRAEKVTLKNEIEALELYLEMEAMRFKNKLHYSIDVAPQLDTELIEIPPMLLQPYVENAIWHGLMHKKEGGLVQIKILQTDNDRLHVMIADDGVGRTKAAELKSKSATANKSFGMKVTHERIALINQLYQTNTQVRVHDLTDAAGNAAGTEVVLDILV